MSCSCPTGDGSLRWPCPEHPPTLADAGAQLDAAMRELRAAVAAIAQPLLDVAERCAQLLAERDDRAAEIDAAMRRHPAGQRRPVALAWVEDERLRDQAAGQSIGTFDEILAGPAPADAPPACLTAQPLIPGRLPIARHARR